METGTVKSSLRSVLPSIQAPRIKRKHLRKYSWLPDVFRLKGSIVGRIAGPVSTVTLFAAMVTYGWSKGYHLVLTNSVVPLLAVVVGLLLVFSTSYDRYWEGRKCFSSLTANVRNISRLIWVNVGLPPTDQQPANIKGKTPISDVTPKQLHRRKVDALKLCLSFAFAVKHYLRGEDGVNWADYRGVLPASFARFDETGYNTLRTEGTESYAATRTNSMALSRDDLSEASSPDTTRPDATKRIRVKRSKSQLVDSSTPLLGNTHRSVEFHPYADEASLPLPLIIAHELTGVIYQFRREGFMETVGPAGTNAMIQLIGGMVDQLTAMERVANTPIPISYGIHLKQCVTLYLFALPLTMVSDLGWATIPIVTVVAFTFMGIEGIADEIEMPFGTDHRDIPLDRYLKDLKEEINYIIERLPEGGEGLHGYDDGEGDD
ncbi:Bestrophin, RFP-TM, chloride channel-domain-containing protein [Infundibulicybe gibba]|nr:Bestrophin, RFP-TM, chloride channel-domain-containing protein [Infundibulicybe gibba]